LGGRRRDLARQRHPFLLAAHALAVTGVGVQHIGPHRVADGLLLVAREAAIDQLGIVHDLVEAGIGARVGIGAEELLAIFRIALGELCLHPLDLVGR
jgi:hypothetical protein